MYKKQIGSIKDDSIILDHTAVNALCDKFITFLRETGLKLNDLKPTDTPDFEYFDSKGNTAHYLRIIEVEPLYYFVKDAYHLDIDITTATQYHLAPGRQVDAELIRNTQKLDLIFKVKIENKKLQIMNTLPAVFGNDDTGSLIVRFSDNAYEEFPVTDDLKKIFDYMVRYINRIKPFLFPQSELVPV
jgi:hypothetical protein